jgi:glutathione-regulated potassium-efflux system ancillary protein KefG
MAGETTVLVLFAHPAADRSRVNTALAAAAREVDGVTVHDLYEAYPEFDVDVEREQELLSRSEAVVLQHPMYWYSTPALVKQWLDLVLEHGWAYGSEARALNGMRMLLAISAGGGREAYTAGGHNRFTIEEFLRPLEQTAALCRMRWLEPFVVYGTHGMSDAELDRRCREYGRRLATLRDECRVEPRPRAPREQAAGAHGRGSV